MYKLSKLTLLVGFVTIVLGACADNELCEKRSNAIARMAIEISNLANGTGNANRALAATQEAQSINELIVARDIKCKKN